MAEEFQAAVCGGGWWNPSRTTFNHSSCSSVLTDIDHFGTCWPSDSIHMKPKSSDDSSDGSIIFQDIQKPGGGTTTMSPDSTFQMMLTAFSNSPWTTTTDWNQNMICRVQEGLNTFSSGEDDGSMDQQEPLNFINTSYGYPSSLLQSQQQPLYDFPSSLNDLNFTPSLNLLRPKQQPGDLHLANNTPFWNASTPALEDNTSSVFGAPQSEDLFLTYKQQHNCSNVTIKPNHQEIPDSGSVVKKSSSEPSFKRPRLETPSPLPTFKVRKEKLGDRITALQQLVSPFGKTDTASVLHEAIEYIKLLHDQVHVLSTPYMRNSATMQAQEAYDEVKDAAVIKQDLRSLGLCLVPVSSTFPVANETTSGFWTPIFGGSFS